MLIMILISSKPYYDMAAPILIAVGAMAGSIGVAIAAGMMSLRRRKH